MLLDKITKHMSARPDALLLHYLCNSMQTWVSILSQFHKARHHIDPSVLRSSDVYKMRSRVGEHKTDVQGKAEPSSRSQDLDIDSRKWWIKVTLCKILREAKVLGPRESESDLSFMLWFPFLRQINTAE